MSQAPSNNIPDGFRSAPAPLPLLSEQFDATIRQGVRKALEEHAAADRSVAIARNGEVVVVPAKELLHEQNAHSEHCI